MVKKALKKKDMFLDNRESCNMAPTQKIIIDNSKFVNKRNTTTTHKQLKNFEHIMSTYFSEEDP